MAQAASKITFKGIGPRIDSVVAGLRELSTRLSARAGAEIEDLTRRVDVVVSELRVLRSTGREFNSFDVLRIGRREYIHSNVLRWLLDPAESHGMSTRFLNQILERAGLPICDEASRFKCRVRREVQGGTS